MPQTTEKPTAAFVLSLIGGIFILLAGVFLGFVGFAITLPLGGFGAALGFLGLLWGILVIVGAIMINSKPDQHVAWGVIVLVFSILSWVGALGGFFIGFLLGLIGGILAIAWKPTVVQNIPGESSFPPQQ